MTTAARKCGVGAQDHLHRGFTLIELLVVVGIIGLILAIVLPAVQAARESSRKSQCSNNLRQLGLAMHNHEAAHGWMPACERNLPLDTYPTDPPNPNLSITVAASSYGPLVYLLPYLEQSVLFSRVDLKRAWHDPINLPPPYGTLNPDALASVATMVCPSTPTVPSDYGSYFQSIGLGQGWPLLAPRGDYIPIKGVQAELNQCAGLQAAKTYNGLLGTDDPEKKPTVSISQVSDGMSQTILFIELAGKQARFFRGRRLQNSGLSDLIPVLNSFFGDPNAGKYITGYSGISSGSPYDPGCGTINITNASAPYSFHSGGVTAAMGDGSVQFLSEIISPREIVSLISRDGAERNDL